MAIKTQATAPEKFIDQCDIFVKKETIEELLSHTKATRLYKVKQEEIRDHEDGEGGYSEEIITLVKGDTVLLVSINFVHWETYSDDSEDHDRVRTKTTYLISHDLVADTMFKFLQEGAKLIDNSQP